MSMFGDISGERLTDPSILGQVLSDLFCALHEREEAVYRLGDYTQAVCAGPDLYTPAPEAFDSIRLETVEENLNILMGALDGLISDQAPALSDVTQQTHHAKYCKFDWSDYADIDDLLADAGYPDGWTADRHTENYDLWYQVRDALLQLRYYQIRAAFGIGTGSTYSDGPWFSASFAWDKVLIRLAANDPGYYGNSRLGFRITKTPSGQFGAFYTPEVAVSSSVSTYFRGKIVAPWSWQWGGKTDTLLLPGDVVQFSNSLGETITLNSGAALTPETFNHITEMDLADLAEITFSVTLPASVPATVPLSSSGMATNSERVAQAYTPREFDDTILFQCDAHSAFSYT